MCPHRKDFIDERLNAARPVHYKIYKNALTVDRVRIYDKQVARAVRGPVGIEWSVHSVLMKILGVSTEQSVPAEQSVDSVEISMV